MSLADDDKTWLLDLLTERDRRLEQSIERLGERIEERIEHVEFRIEQLDLKIDSVERRLEEKIERVETSLLTEFHKWASPQEARARTHAAALRAIDLEMEALSDRVAKLEPPAA
jgi:hypothetical protein